VLPLVVFVVPIERSMAMRFAMFAPARIVIAGRQ
jgi:hypothetical protein